MDFPVEATVHLTPFRDQRHPLDVLRFHGFQVTDSAPGRVRVKGSFSQLKAVKLQLEQLEQNQRGRTGEKDFYGDTKNRSQSLPRQKSTAAATASRREQEPASQSLPRSPTKPGRETIVIDSDVFKYADRVRKKETDDILTRYAVTLTVQESGDASTITVRGRNCKVAAAKLQDLLDHLRASLRTQEVPRADLDPRDGLALLEQIRRHGNVHGSVLVRETKDGLRLVGPSQESFELQQRLMGNSAGRRGRSQERASSARRSFTLDSFRKKKVRNSNLSPQRGAAGYSPPRNWVAWDDNNNDGRQPVGGATRGPRHWFSFRGRNQKKTNGVPPKREEPQWQQQGSPSTPAPKFLNDPISWFKNRKRKT
ncbi:unnamed protein product [Ophioblennius macclurei]